MVYRDNRWLMGARGTVGAMEEGAAGQGTRRWGELRVPPGARDADTTRRSLAKLVSAHLKKSGDIRGPRRRGTTAIQGAHCLQGTS